MEKKKRLSHGDVGGAELFNSDSSTENQSLKTEIVVKSASSEEPGSENKEAQLDLSCFRIY